MVGLGHRAAARYVAAVSFPDPTSLLAAYDAQLRAEGELHAASWREEHPPVWWARFEEKGFVTYASLGSEVDLDGLITEAVAHFRDHTKVTEFEWKTRGHDQLVDLDARLRAHGLVPGPKESVMIGEAVGLAREVPLADSVVVRRAGDGGDLAADVARAVAMQGEVFGNDNGPSPEFLTATIQAEPRLVELWVAEVDGAVVSAGRIDVVPGTEFAGIWGGATLPEWRGRGIYRALTAARARSALARGVRYIHSDSTAMSRPILERSGLREITTTTPYVWTRP